MRERLLAVEDLTVTFVEGDKAVRAVNGVSFGLDRGEVMEILGESGSGKSVTLRALLGLLPTKKARISGTARLDGQDLLNAPARELADLRGSKLSMIFQEPASALDPIYMIGDQIAESLMRHEGLGKRAAWARAVELLDEVQIPSAAQRAKAYPQEVSGGMLQRAMIALALACKPSVLLADEPTTALDVSVQIQILLLLRRLQQKRGMSIIFVSHDLGVINEISDRVAVMYAGRFVETGASKRFSPPRTTRIRVVS
jgi:peptide/nickel transport system ATP-binding protein